MDYRKLYKENPCSKNRTINNKESLFASRRSKRLENFNNNRKDLIVDEIKVAENGEKINDRRAMLLKWKQKKLQEKKIENKKKPFVVGIIRHNIGSPLFKDISNFRKVKCQNTKENIKKPKVGSAIKGNSPIREFPFLDERQVDLKFKFQVHPSLKKLTIPQSPNFLSAKKKQFKAKTSNLIKTEKDVNQKENVGQNRRTLRSRKRLIPDDPKADNIKSPVAKKSKIACDRVFPATKDTADVLAQDVLSCHVQLHNLPAQDTTPRTPIPDEEANRSEEQEFVISPFVTLTRGKQRHSLVSRPVDSAKKQSLRRMYNRTVSPLTYDDDEEKSEAAPYFARLDKETKRIISLCDDWSKMVVAEQGIPKEVEDEIDSVVGQSRLLVKDKFQQFRSLVERFECKVEPAVRLDDLEGFWDMMYIQVEKLDDNFLKLASLKENGWKRVNIEKPVKLAVKKLTKKEQTENSKKPPLKARGNFRQFLQEMKKKSESPNSSSELALTPNKIGVRLPECQVVGSPRKSGASESLLKRVLSNSIHEKVNVSTKAAYNTVRTSLIGKELGTSPVKLVDESISCNSPSNKSILKKSPANCSIVKKKVLFGDNSHFTLSDQDTTEEEDILNSTFTFEEEHEQHCQPHHDQENSMITDERWVEETASTAEDQQLPPITDSASVAFDSSVVTPRRSRKRIASTPRGNFTPRRSTRLMAKAETSTPALQHDFISVKQSKKGPGTPHPKKK